MFATIVRRWGSDVLRFARSQLPTMQDAEDVYQETFRILYQGNRTFADDDHLKRWLFAVASNRCKHFYRRQSRKRLDVLDPQSPAFRELVDGRDVQGEPDYSPDHDVWDYVASLPRAQREAIALYYVGGYSVDDIAAIVHAQPATIRTRLFRARRALKRTMEKGGEYGFRAIPPRDDED